MVDFDPLDCRVSSGFMFRCFVLLDGCCAWRRSILLVHGFNTGTTVKVTGFDLFVSLFGGGIC